MNQQNRRPLVSREDRNGVSASNGVEAEAPPEGDGGVEGRLAEVMEIARSEGYIVRKASRHRRVRPWGEGGIVRFSCRMSAEVREALELAKPELDMHASEIVEKAVIEFLAHRGLRVEGVSSPRQVAVDAGIEGGPGGPAEKSDGNGAGPAPAPAPGVAQEGSRR